MNWVKRHLTRIIENVAAFVYRLEDKHSKYFCAFKYDVPELHPYHPHSLWGSCDYFLRLGGFTAVKDKLSGPGPPLRFKKVYRDKKGRKVKIKWCTELGFGISSNSIPVNRIIEGATRNWGCGPESALGRWQEAEKVPVIQNTFVGMSRDEKRKAAQWFKKSITFWWELIWMIFSPLVFLLAFSQGLYYIGRVTEISFLSGDNSLGIACFGMLIFVIWRERKNKKASEETKSSERRRQVGQ